jgi:hypothetical protein
MALLFHHGPRERGAESPVVALIANVNLLVHRVEEGNFPAALEVFDPETLRFLGLGSAAIEAAARIAQDEAEEETPAEPQG